MKLSPDHPDFDRYRPNVGVVVLNEKNQVFVAQRIDSPGPAWQMPQGGIDDGENTLTAAKRELYEETSIQNIAFIAQFPEDDSWLYYDLPSELQQKLWGGGFKGQRQKWFAFRFLGHDSDINLETDHPEFSDWKWVPAAELPNLSVDFKKDLYTEISTFIKNNTT